MQNVLGTRGGHAEVEGGIFSHFPYRLTKSVSDVVGRHASLSITDLIVFVYLLMFVLWILSFTYKICRSIKSYYSHDARVLALHQATYDNNTTLALALCKRYPYAINKTIDDEKFTPFLRACYHGNTQLVKYMLTHDANLESRTVRNENGFYLAVFNRIRNRTCKDASCIHTLYHAGIDVDAVNVNGLNVLQLAAMFGHKSLVRWLLQKKVNYRVHPDPYFLAKSNGHMETAEVLRQFGALTT